MKFNEYNVLWILLLFVYMGLAKNYKGAEYRTKETFIYGRFEVSYKPPAGDGFLASFFTYHELENGIEDWNEIDLEILGRYKDNIQFNAITPGQTNHDAHFYVPFNPQIDFHTYAFEWTPDYVAWFVDGDELYRQTGDHIQTLNLEQKLMMNIWIPAYENWVGVWNPQLLPKFAYYDWVSYASYSPGIGDAGTDQNFSLQWKDEFDSWDTDRWEKATHTWNGNLTDFKTENVVFKDGNMILCLTDTDDLGLVDHIPPYMLWARAVGNKVKIRFSEELDSLTAQKTSSYVINGLTTEQAILQADGCEVELRVSPIDTSQSYSVVVLGVKDRSNTPNTQMGQVMPLYITKPLSYPVKINVGGDPIYDEFLGDQAWGVDTDYGYLDGYSKEWGTATEIAGTEQDLLYVTELNGLVKYKVRVPDGIYSVTLHFAENEFNEIGKRELEVVVEDSSFAEKFDLVSKVGSHSAYDVTFQSIPVQDGIIDIHLINWVERAILNGLTVEQISTGIKGRVQITPKKFEMSQNYPNPFNPETLIELTTRRIQSVQLTVYNSAGQKIKVIYNNILPSGKHQLYWDGNNEQGLPMPSGVYYAYAKSESGNNSIKMILLR